MNENGISALLSPPSALNSSMPIKNDMNVSNRMSNVSNATSMLARKRAEIASTKNENHRSINENTISIPFLPISTRNSIMAI